MDVLEKPGHAALRKGRVSVAGQIYLVTSTTCQRQPLFADFHCAATVTRSFVAAFLSSDSRLLAWVLMPDHVHWLIELGHHESLALLMKRLKSLSAFELNWSLQRSGALWDAGFHNRALRFDDDVKQAARFWNAIWL